MSFVFTLFVPFHCPFESKEKLLTNVNANVSLKKGGTIDGSSA
jgi:hypothetical protein